MKSNFYIIIAFTVLVFFTGCENTDSKASNINANKVSNKSNVAIVTNAANASNSVPLANNSNLSNNSASANFNPKLNVTNFNKLSQGMTYAEVVKIFGSKGESLGEAGSGATKTVMYQWLNPDGSFVKVVFQNDKLYDKVHTGLR